MEVGTGLESGRFAFLLPDLLVLVPIPGQKLTPRVAQLAKACHTGLQSPALIQLSEDEGIAFALIAFERLIGFLLIAFFDPPMLPAQTVKQAPQPFPVTIPRQGRGH